MTVEEWQEVECPNQGTDFDLSDERMVYEGDTFDCSECWGQHVATSEIMQEYRRDADGETHVVPLRKRTDFEQIDVIVGGRIVNYQCETRRVRITFTDGGVVEREVTIFPGESAIEAIERELGIRIDPDQGDGLPAGATVVVTVPG